jgi:hypothetical protein
MPKGLLKGVVQIGIVTRDLDRVIRVWSDKYYVGPWHVHVFDPSNMNELTLDGEPAEYGMRIALASLGSMMLEVIEPTDDRSIYAKSLETHGGADHVHHILCATDAYRPALEQFAASGVRTTQTGRSTATGARFAYLATEDDLGFAIEISHRSGERTLPQPVEVYPPSDQSSL